MRPLVFAVWLFTLLLAAWFAYAPGLGGGFVFDDLGANLPALGNYGSIDNWIAFVQYITSGIADPTGRPFSLLTFLLNANNWPADPEPFKYTNILLHLLNGALLCWLLLRLGPFTGRPNKQITQAALLGAGIWLLHPFFVSTTLYIVQREAMLVGTFVLLGLLAYLRGRELIVTHAVRGCCWIVLGVGTCTVLGTLSKANGILLPLYIAVVELIFLRSQQPHLRPPRNLSRCLAIVVYPPAIAVLGYLVYVGANGLINGIGKSRPWTLGQRLLTEPRALLDYITSLLIPRPYSRGLFNDSFHASQNLWHPWTTLPALVIVIGLIVFAIAWRKRFPVLALAAAFFFAGQVMESSTLPLELYFEHRNYVPAMLMFWPLALWLTGDGALARLRPVISVGILLLLAAETYIAATLWGSPQSQALTWALQNPDSVRAQGYAASIEQSRGYPGLAEIRLRRTIAAHPDNIALSLNLLSLRCRRGSIRQPDMAAALHALRYGRHRGAQTINWIAGMIPAAKAHTCQGLTLGDLQDLAQAAGENEATQASPLSRQAFISVEGQIALAAGQKQQAEDKFMAALKVLPRAETALAQAAILGSHHMPRAGLQQLDTYRRLVPSERPPKIRNMQDFHKWILYKEGYWQREIAHMRGLLEDDLKSAKVSKSPSLGSNPDDGWRFRPSALNRPTSAFSFIPSPGCGEKDFSEYRSHLSPPPRAGEGQGGGDGHFSPSIPYQTAS